MSLVPIAGKVQAGIRKNSAVLPAKVFDNVSRLATSRFSDDGKFLISDPVNNKIGGAAKRLFAKRLESLQQSSFKLMVRTGEKFVKLCDVVLDAAGGIRLKNRANDNLKPENVLSILSKNFSS